MKYPCLCCGYKTMDEQPPDTYDICEICGWEDDSSDGGANKVTLEQAKENFKFFSKSDSSCPNTRKPTNEDDRDPNWEKLNYDSFGTK